MDHVSVTLDDLGSNFFLDRDDIGRPRATALAALLGELNPECTIRSSIRDPVAFIESCRRTPENEDIRFLRKFSLGPIKCFRYLIDCLLDHSVLASEIPLQLASQLCEKLYSENIPILHARSFGLIGTLRLGR